MESTISTAEGIFMVVYMGIFFVIYLAMIGVSITGYVLQALGMYRIAQRRGIHHPWLAWIPVANSWVLGSISDHYQYVTKHKQTKRRRIIPILEAAMIVVYIAVFATMLAMAFSMDSATTVANEIGILFAMLFGLLILFGVAVTAVVFAYLACFDLFRSCRPQNEVLFLVLGIVVPITLPFFIFACSKYDLGMPPKREPQIPAQIPCTPVEEPVENEPVEEPPVEDAPEEN